MKNPWEQVPLQTYEAHMSLSQVAQLQALNRIMKSQWQAKPEAVCAAVFGVAGGNGLEHCGDTVRTIYGIDINGDYLRACAERFGPVLGERLQLRQMDLTDTDLALPQVDLIIADLLIEYIGVERFCACAAETGALYVSCVVQQQSHTGDFVSSSPYQADFIDVGRLHQDVEPEKLQAAFAGYGYIPALRDTMDLPNGKRFLRLDYKRGTSEAPEKK